MEIWTTYSSHDVRANSRHTQRVRYPGVLDYQPAVDKFFWINPKLLDSGSCGFKLLRPVDDS
jgi:hypothetical protein